jgi:hypothetical protein
MTLKAGECQVDKLWKKAFPSHLKTPVESLLLNDPAAARFCPGQYFTT